MHSHRFKKNSLCEYGAAATEFLLAVPVLFLFFFCLVQLFHLAHGALAAQAAAGAAARTFAETGDEKLSQARASTFIAPLGFLQTQYLLSSAALNTKTETNKEDLFYTLTVPQPLLVPIAKNVFAHDPSFSFLMETKKAWFNDLPPVLDFLAKKLLRRLSFLEKFFRLPVVFQKQQVLLFNEAFLEGRTDTKP